MATFARAWGKPKPAPAAIVGTLLALPLIVLWRAWVIVTLWAWFLVPLGVPAVGMAHAFGLVTLLGVLAPRAVLSDADEAGGRGLGLPIARAFLGPLVALACGAVAAGLMP